VFAGWAASTWPKENAGANASGRTHRRLTGNRRSLRGTGESYSDVILRLVESEAKARR
jgi:hypothetical protein